MEIKWKLLWRHVCFVIFATCLTCTTRKSVLSRLHPNSIALPCCSTQVPMPTTSTPIMVAREESNDLIVITVKVSNQLIFTIFTLSLILIPTLRFWIYSLGLLSIFILYDNSWLDCILVSNCFGCVFLVFGHSSEECTEEATYWRRKKKPFSVPLMGSTF